MATAFDASYPYDDQDAAEAEWREIFRALGSGVVADKDNELLVFGDSSGRQVKVMTGRIWAAGEFGKLTAQKTMAVTANSSGQPRIDRLIARNNFTANQIELDVLAGTPGASPTPPALTSNSSMQEFSLAQIGPLASGYTTIAPGDVTPERCLISLIGPSIYDDANALALWVPSPTQGLSAYLRDSGDFLQYHSSAIGWGLPWLTGWGFQGRIAKVTADQGSISTITNVTGGSFTFTAIKNRIYRYHVRALVSNTTADGDCAITITDGANAELTNGSHAVLRVPGAGDFETLDFSFTETFGATGAVTRKLRASAAAGLMALQNGTVQLEYSIEDVGASGAPS